MILKLSLVRFSITMRITKMATIKKKSLQQVYQEKTDRLMEGIAYWAAYYRLNPNRFIIDFLNITKLKVFQKINIHMMMQSTNMLYCAARGGSKSWTLALFCIVKCILYPGTQICIASLRKEQSLEVILKIVEDFMKNYGWGSSNLRNEIEEYSTSINNPHIYFKNGSFIKVVVASDSARHNRATIIIIDEFYLVDLNIINTVLRKFLTAERSPGYLNNPEYAHLKERNCEMYAGSCWHSSHWSFEKLKTYFANMLNDEKKYFCCGLPYQLSIKEGLLSREQVEDEMSEADFDAIAFEMEMGCMFHDDSSGSFYSFEDIQKRRKIKNAFYPLQVYRSLDIKPPQLQFNERRLLSVDIALLGNHKNKNDATCLTINSCIPTEDNYISNIVYIETYEGITADVLAVIILRAYYNYNCTDLVIDGSGVGQPIIDLLMKNQYDDEYQVTYEGLSCCNNQEIASRCTLKNAKKVIWVIKASSESNSKDAILLRTGFQNNRINLLIPEYECDDVIQKIKGYSKLSPTEKAMLKLPYLQTSLLINEIVNLDVELKGINVKVKERTNARKDRFSSLEYSFKVASEISLNERKPTIEKEILKQFAYVRQPRMLRQSQVRYY